MNVRIRRGMMASVSGNVATMGNGIPYAIAAKFAHPARCVVTCVGDGAMQMSGINGLITIAKYWKRWRDPRLVILVNENLDLDQVDWELRTMTGIPKYEASQDVPPFPYAEYATSRNRRRRSGLACPWRSRRGAARMTSVLSGTASPDRRAAPQLCDTQFTHAADAQARLAVPNALFFGLGGGKASVLAMPWCTFTSPEVAHVGMTALSARRGVIRSTRVERPATRVRGTQGRRAAATFNNPHEVSMPAEYRMSLPVQTIDTAEPRARAVLEHARAQVGFIPNMYATMVNSPGLLETYLSGYKAFREESGFTPVEQEVVFLTISRENGCQYCLAAHSTLADNMSKVPPAVTDAIRNDDEIPDARLAALSAFTRTMFATRGLVPAADAEAFLAAGFTERQMLEVVLALAVKTLSNYSNHLFHTDVDPVFAKRSWSEPAGAAR